MKTFISPFRVQVLLILLYFIPHLIMAQGFERVYPMPGTQRVWLMKLNETGPFAICDEGSPSYPNLVMAQFSFDGTPSTWQSKGGVNVWRSGCFTRDNGFIVASEFDVTYYNSDIEVTKYDSLGNILWSLTLGDSIRDKPSVTGMSEAIDENIYLLTQTLIRTGSYTYTPQNKSLYKINPAGSVLWKIDFPSYWGSPAGIISGPDPGSMVMLIDNGRYNYIKIDQDGTIQWQKTGTIPKSNPAPLTRTSDNGFALLGIENYPETRWANSVVKFNSVGDSLWNFILADPDTSIKGYSWIGPIEEVSDGGIVFAGTHEDVNNTVRGYIAKISSAGSLEWVHLLNESIYIKAVKEDSLGYLYFMGYVSLSSSDIWLLKTDSRGLYSNNHLSGYVYYDDNLSCTDDSLESPLSHWLVKGDGQLAYHYATTNHSGRYSMQTQIDTYNVHVFPLSPYWLPCHNDDTLVFSQSLQEDTLDFGIKPLVYCPWMEVSIAGSCRVKRGNREYFSVRYCNYGTVAASNVNIDVTFPSEMSVESASVPFIQSGQTLSFSIGTVDYGDCDWFTIRVLTDTSLTLGDVLCASAHITPDSICLPGYNGYNPSIDALCSVVVGSFDPNDKLGNPFGETENHFIQADTQLSFIINFQNTGTDTAFRVEIIDTLPEQLDVTSFRAGASSHEYDYEIFGEGIVRFIFDLIALPDSNADEPNSKGFIKFSINQIPGLLDGATIVNRAAIYFDLNDPVITEPWIYTIGEGPVINEIISTPPTCNADSDGTLQIIANGLNPPYQFSIDNGVSFQTGNTFDSLAAGIYEIVMMDTKGVQAINSITIFDHPIVDYSASLTNTTCDNSADGQLILIGESGDGGPYSYSIDSGVTFQTENNFTALEDATYSIVVKDASGCEAFGTETIEGGILIVYILQNQTTLTATSTIFSYQWIDCKHGNTAISGETNQSFTATESGSYAVVFADGVCSDTSSCYGITVPVGINNNTDFVISLFPNPATTKIHIPLNRKYQTVKVTVMNVLGQEMLNYSLEHLEIIELNTSPLNTGVYFIKIIADTQSGLLKFSKE